jgi:hypothetical protein
MDGSCFAFRAAEVGRSLHTSASFAVVAERGVSQGVSPVGGRGTARRKPPRCQMLWGLAGRLSNRDGPLCLLGPGIPYCVEVARLDKMALHRHDESWGDGSVSGPASRWAEERPAECVAPLFVAGLGGHPSLWSILWMRPHLAEESSAVIKKAAIGVPPLVTIPRVP